MFDSAKLYFKGPVWKVVGVVSGMLTVIGLALAATHVSVAVVLAFLLVAALALVFASFYSFQLDHFAEEAKKESLPQQIDDLHRDGLVLLEELSRPPEPERGEGEVTYKIGPPAGAWEKAEAFDQRIRDLFVARYPALLSDYANGFNAHRRERREREAMSHRIAERDKRSIGEKLQEFIDRIHRGPERALEDSLEGLAQARHRVSN